MNRSALSCLLQFRLKLTPMDQLAVPENASLLSQEQEVLRRMQSSMTQGSNQQQHWWKQYVIGHLSLQRQVHLLHKSKKLNLLILKKIVGRALQREKRNLLRRKRKRNKTFMFLMTSLMELAATIKSLKTQKQCQLGRTAISWSNTSPSTSLRLTKQLRKRRRQRKNRKKILCQVFKSSQKDLKCFLCKTT